jgi:hypothetical protein
MAEVHVIVEIPRQIAAERCHNARALAVRGE